MTNKQDRITYRINKCRQSLKDAQLLMENESYLSAVNRMYYALFYIVTAYLLISDFIVKSHNGVKIKFHQELTLSNVVTREEAKLYELLFMRRHEFDYDDFLVFDENEIKGMFAQVKAMIEKIEKLITDNTNK